MRHTFVPSRHTSATSHPPVITMPLGAVATLYSWWQAPAGWSGSDTTGGIDTASPENGRNFIVSFAASHSTWHVGATAAMSWASGSW